MSHYDKITIILYVWMWWFVEM